MIGQSNNILARYGAPWCLQRRSDQVNCLATKNQEKTPRPLGCGQNNFMDRFPFNFPNTPMLLSKIHTILLLLKIHTILLNIVSTKNTQSDRRS